MSEAPSSGQSKGTADIEWSSRQREVLALLAARKTNGEIASALGISLDGAKYHVREILDRLDVDTREEAAEWWRQQRGAKARMQVVMRRWRMPALLKLGGAGAAAAVAIVAVGIFLASPGGDEEEGLDPGLWVAMAVPETQEGQPEGRPEIWQLRMKRMDGAESHVLATVSLPGRPAWSPDGSFVAIEDVEGDPQSSDRALVLVDTSSGAIVRTPLGGAAYSHLRWSPDGQILAAYTASTLLLFGRDGALLAEVDLDSFGAENERDASDRILGWPQWRADSSSVVVPAGNEVAVIDRSGAILAVSDRGEWLPSDVDVAPPDPGMHYWPPLLDSWSGADEVVVRVPAGGSGDFWTVRGVLQGGALAWEEEPGGTVPGYFATDFGALPPNWIQDYRPFASSFSVGASVSYGGVTGTIALYHDEEGARLLPGGATLPEGTGVALAIQANGDVQTLKIDMAPEVASSLSGRGGGVMWDVVEVTE